MYALEIIVVIIALTACVFVLFMVWLVWSALGLLGRAGSAVYRSLGGGSAGGVPRLNGVAVARCPRRQCLAVNPAEARFCRRCGQGMAAPQRVARAWMY